MFEASVVEDPEFVLLDSLTVILSLSFRFFLIEVINCNVEVGEQIEQHRGGGVFESSLHRRVFCGSSSIIQKSANDSVEDWSNNSFSVVLVALA